MNCDVEGTLVSRSLRMLQWYVGKHGFLRLAWFGLRRLWRLCFKNREVMFCLDLERLDEGRLENAGGLSVAAYRDLESIPRDDMRQLVEQKGKEILMRFLHSFFKRGAVLWLGKIEQRVVALQWTVKGGFNGFYHFPMAKTDVVEMAAEVFPAYRGRAIHSHLNRLMFQQLRADGVSRAYWSAKVWNESSLRSAVKISATRIGIVRTFSLFNRWITIWEKRSLAPGKSSD